MEGDEISAFAAYSTNKKQKKIDLKKNSKFRLKKKKLKSRGNKVNLVLNTLMKGAQSSASDNLEVKCKKEQKKKELIKSALKAQKESIFKNCIVTNKVDNMFLRENGFPEKCINENGFSKNSEGTSKLKNLKKKKMINSELKSFENTTDNFNSVENSFFLNEKKVVTKSGSNKNTEIFQSSKKNGLKDSKEKVKLPSVIYSDSIKVGEEVFSWILSPLSLKEFFENCWEQKPLHIEHKDRSYFKCICTLEDFKEALKGYDMYFTRNIDVTSYIDGERNTENPDGRAKPALVWDFYKKGRSIRLLNPQTYIQNVRLLNTALQEFFHCFVGANIYLTPPGAQGFAPHYDDIEAFVMQLEGEKHWKLYNPRSAEEVLPRVSSRNFTEDEIGEPILEVTLKPGDLLYFPRGIIHQAKCMPHVHSLHITVSCYQKNAWADLFEKVLPVALQKAISEDVEFRKGLPIGYLNSSGMIYSDQESFLRQEFIKKFEELAKKVLDECPLDAGVDQLGATFVHDALPPCLTEVEKQYGADRNLNIEEKDILTALKNSFKKNLKVKLIRATCIRLVSEQEEMVLYYTTDNSLVYHEQEVFSVCVSIQWAQAIEYLIRSYPKFVEMKELPVSNKINKPGEQTIAELKRKIQRIIGKIDRNVCERVVVNFNDRLKKSKESRGLAYCRYNFLLIKKWKNMWNEIK